MEKYKKENAKDHFSFYLGSNTLSSYPTYDLQKFPNKVTLFGINSQMEDFLRERQILFRTALSRKLFFHRYQKFGMDEVHFTEAESNVNDLVWEYGSIHQMGGNPGVSSLFDEEGATGNEQEPNQGIGQGGQGGDMRQVDR